MRAIALAHDCNIHRDKNEKERTAEISIATHLQALQFVTHAFDSSRSEVRTGGAEINPPQLATAVKIWSP